MSTPTRFPFVDAAKALGIILVVVGHAAGLPQHAVDLIFSFHMPLFFFLSGYLLSSRKLAAPFREFATTQLRDLGIPYVVFFFLSYGYWLATAGIGPKAAKFADIAWYAPLKGMLTGIGADLFINQALWFFPGLLVTALLYHIARRWLTLQAATLVFIVTGYLVAIVLDRPSLRIPLDVDIALVAVAFYAFGAWIRHHESAWSERPLPLSDAALWLMLLLPPFVALGLGNRPVDMNEMAYGQSPLLFMPTALLGIAIVLVITKCLPESRVLRWLSDNTLIIFPSHALVLNFLSGIAKVLFGKAGTELMPPVAWAVLSALIAILAAYPLAAVLSRLMPNRFGRRIRAHVNPAAVAPTPD